MVDEGGSGSSSLMSTIFSGDKNRTRSEQLIPIIKIHWDDVEDPLIVAICIGFGATLNDFFVNGVMIRIYDSIG